MHLVRNCVDNKEIKKNSCRRLLCRRGFTLVELLIAVAILAVVVTAIYATLFNVLDSRESMQANMDRLRSFRRFSASFQREARASFFSPDNPVTLWQGSGGTSTTPPLASLSMTFFTYPSGQDRSGDLMAVSYSAESSEDGMITLYRESWNPYTGKHGMKAEVLEDIEGVRALFYDGAKWVDSWDGTDRKGPPQAVSLLVDIKALGGVETLSTTVLTMVK